MKLSLEEIEVLSDKAYLKLSSQDLEKILVDLNESYLSLEKIKDLAKLGKSVELYDFSNWLKVLRDDEPQAWAQDEIESALNLADLKEGSVKVRRVLAN